MILDYRSTLLSLLSAVARPTTTVTQAEGDGVIMLEGDEETSPAPE